MSVGGYARKPLWALHEETESNAQGIKANNNV